MGRWVHTSQLNVDRAWFLLPHVAFAGRTTSFWFLCLSRGKVPVLFVVDVRDLLDDRCGQFAKMRPCCSVAYSRGKVCRVWRRLSMCSSLLGAETSHADLTLAWLSCFCSIWRRWHWSSRLLRRLLDGWQSPRKNFVYFAIRLSLESWRWWI